MITARRLQKLSHILFVLLLLQAAIAAVLSVWGHTCCGSQDIFPPIKSHPSHLVNLAHLALCTYSGCLLYIHNKLCANCISCDDYCDNSTVGY